MGGQDAVEKATQVLEDDLARERSRSKELNDELEELRKRLAAYEGNGDDPGSKPMKPQKMGPNGIPLAEDGYELGPAGRKKMAQDIKGLQKAPYPVDFGFFQGHPVRG